MILANIWILEHNFYVWLIENCQKKCQNFEKYQSFEKCQNFEECQNFEKCQNFETCKNDFLPNFWSLTKI